MTLKIGLLGAGRIGQIHARNIADHENSTLVAVSDINVSAAKTVADQFNATAKTSQEIVAEREIDAILIATPTNTHSDLIEAATAAGKAVLCEKPIDLSLKRACDCQRQVKELGQPVMIGFNRRFDPNFAALKAALQADEIGETELLSITSFDPAPPPISYIKTSGGLFRDMMIHDFDMANFIMRVTPTSVQATGSSLVDPEINAVGDVDTAVVTLTYEDGRIAVIKNSRRAIYGYDQRIEILGSKGLLQAQNVLENTILKSTSNGITQAKPVHFFLERYMAAYKAEWAGFVDALLNNAPMPVTLNDGVVALAMAEAASLSMAEKMPVIMSEFL